ncbi:VOC family protein [Streptomyces sp. NPDC006261]|uniref:VOC family protein n=1 Tax=Streptomyces sp. NPDC006261 TaxID=3156739 RepID=UPI0033B0E5FE
MVHVGTVVMGASDVQRAAAFWKAALTYTEREPGTDDWVVLVAAEGPGVGVAPGRSASPVREVPRAHLDLHSATQEAEVERLIGLGADRVAWELYPPDPDFVVLAGTEGNRFCVIDTTHGGEGAAGLRG